MDDTKKQNHNESSNEQPEQAASSQATQNESPWHEQFLRVSADFSNYKRRMQQEQISWMRTAQVDVLKKLLPILDDLDAAIKAGQQEQVATQSPKWFEGCMLIAKNLHKTLQDMGVERINCTGEFNPHMHEALMQVATDTVPSGHIVTELSPGYKIGDSIIRHAKVSVAA